MHASIRTHERAHTRKLKTEARAHRPTDQRTDRPHAPAALCCETGGGLLLLLLGPVREHGEAPVARGERLWGWGGGGVGG